jgi:hypothetical protein
MRNSLTAVILCIAAQASFACLAAADSATQGSAPLKAHVISTHASGGELIATASAATTHETTAVTRPAPLAAEQDTAEHPRHAGPAMLLAALALMSGIALRRYSAGSR